MTITNERSLKYMIILATEKDYLWLAKQRPHNKRQNRILLLNAKKRTLPRTEKPTNVTDDLVIVSQFEENRYAN